MYLSSSAHLTKVAVASLLFFAFSAVAAASPRLILNDDGPSGCVLGEETRITASGDLFVAVTNLEDCLPTGTGLGVSQVVVVPNSVLPPDAVQVIWTSVGAETCRAGGNLAAWANQGTLPLEGQRTFDVPSGTSSGAYRLEVLCSVGGGAEVSGQASDNLTVTSPSAPPQPSLSLSTSGPINPGASVTVNWSSENATSCSAGGTFPPWFGSKATSGSQTIDTSTSLAPNTYSLTLTCTNAGGTSLAAQTSIVVEAASPGACSGDRAPPPGMTRTQNCLLSPQTGNCHEFDQIFSEFPGNTSIRWFSMPQNTYVAARIQTQVVPADARANITTDALQNPYGSYFAGPMLWSISTCPGDFNQQAITDELGPGCVGSVPSGIIQYGGTSWINNNRCALRSNETYYLNLLFTNQEPGTPNSSLDWFCQADNCGFQIRGSNITGW